MKTEQILDEYRNGDGDKRLSLFLTYRELRDEFSRIDQDKDAYQFSGILSHFFPFGTS